MFTHVNLSPNTGVQQQWRWRVETRVAMRAFNQHSGVMRVLEARMEAATLMRHRNLREGPIPIPVFQPTSSCDTLRFTVKYDAHNVQYLHTYMLLFIRIFLGRYAIPCSEYPKLSAQLHYRLAKYVSCAFQSYFLGRSF